MDLWGADRAQSVQVGAVILFGFVIIGLSVYQVTVVPAQNKQIEFEQSNVVRDDMVQLRNGLQTSGVTGESRAVEVKLGTQFPARTLFVNPPPTTGTLRTEQFESNVTVNVTNGATVETSGDPAEVFDYWRDNPPNFTTARVVYDGNYRVFTEAARNITINLGHVVANYDANRVNVTTEPAFVSDDRITLVLVSGDLSVSGTTERTVEPTVVSQVTRRELINGKLNLTVPTQFSADQMATLLNASSSPYIDTVTDAGGANVTIAFNATDGRTLALGIAAVHFGPDPPDREVGYVDIDSYDRNVSVTDESRITVEVRDQYGNPLSGQRVRGVVNDTANATLTPVGTNRTGPNGRVVYELQTGTLPTGVNETDLQLNFTTDPSAPGFDPEDPHNASVRVTLSKGPDLADLEAKIAELEAELAATNKTAEKALANGTTGGENGTADGIGQGSVSNYNETQQTTLSTAGGIWQNITNADAIRLTRPQFSPVKPGGDPAPAKRYFQLAFTIRNETVEYSFILGDKNAIQYQINGGSLQVQSSKVYLYRYNKTTDTTTKLIGGKELNEGVLLDWIKGSRLDLLNNQSYEKPDKREPALAEVRRFIETERVDLFVTDLKGRVGVTIGNRTEAAFREDYGSRNTEPTAIDLTSDSNSKYGAVKLGLINTLPATAVDRIENITISVPTGPSDATQISNLAGGTGRYEATVHYENTSGTEAYIDNTVVLGNDTTFDATAGVQADTAIVVYLNRIANSSGGELDLERGDVIRLTITYTIDGTTYTQTLRFVITQRATDSIPKLSPEPLAQVTDTPHSRVFVAGDDSRIRLTA